LPWCPNHCKIAAMFEEFGGGEIERERYITRAEIMHALNDPRSYGIYPVELGSKNSAVIMSLISGEQVFSESMINWTNDVLDSFRIDRTRWTERVMQPTGIAEVLKEHSAEDASNLGSFMIAETERQLYASVTEGYATYAGKVTMRLNDVVNLDMCSEGAMWTDRSDYDYEMRFWGVFRKAH
jgi:hypothetical protein